jgi:formate hydrogenlyase subunit 3/multisubunit Na+/H+ antiporter MnhD subunit
MKFHAITVICILLFIGAAEKSAQIGLHTWLPDEISGHNCYLYFFFIGAIGKNLHK